MKIILILVLLTSCTLAESQLKFKLMGEDSRTFTDSILKEQPQSLDPIGRFFVVGDFGDLQSEGDLDHVTNIMDSINKDQEIDFIATVGDNVYENGIESMDKLDDVNQIMNSFKKPNLKHLPMYLTLGNHDCYSDYKNQIKYSEHDKQWNMESDYYKLKFPLKDDPSKFMVLLMSNSCLLPCLNEIKGSNGKMD